ncbi:MAG: class I SAM-dependent methyltransferase [Pseudomonadales bacterium]|nr:class I SAM-dependent methyltransferase [Pseudomonadales bacterium]
MAEERFDQAYYHQYYENPETRAVSPQEQKAQAHFIAAYLRYLNIEIHSGTDFGCGTGVMLGAFETEFPQASWTGVEVSAYLCKTYGWRQGSVVDSGVDPSDLVICSDVLGYLSPKDCRQALKNLTRATQHVLYLSVLTKEDLDICDQDITDMTQAVRSAAWYKDQLNNDFVNIGGGLFLKRPLDVPVWQMEML